MALELVMRKSSWTPSIVPNGDDQDVYIVLDDFGRNGRAYRETDVPIWKQLFGNESALVAAEILYQPSTIAEGPRRQDDSAVDDDEARPPNQGRDHHGCRY
jgi:hypothetical protein